MSINEIIAIAFFALVWHIIFAFLFSSITNSSGVEFVNPVFLHENLEVNWFGAFFLAIIFSLLTILFALGYWLYKLCTIGV